jgi:hypothetical protein
LWLAVAVIGLALGGLVVGFQPTGADPDLLYRPIKSELARALRANSLPFWSDCFGLGVPLVAESHAAAFYPPNWVLYRAFDVDTAYRLAMWMHHVLLATAVFLYARYLGITPWGAALSLVAFTLCAFMSIHAGHEPFYHVLPLIPVALIAADRYVATGRMPWMAGLALVWGLQLVLGHFQIQSWTAVLVLVLGGWRQVVDRRPRTRVLGLVAALAWGAAIAAVQLALTAELVLSAGFARTTEQRTLMAFPPLQWIQAALPALFLRLKGGTVDRFWAGQMTTGGEAAFWIGTMPLILACIGWRGRRDRPDPLAPWKVIAVVAATLASLPALHRPAYMALVQLPIVGWFRAPARFTLVTSFGLALLAGRGFDRAIAGARFLQGVAWAVGVAALSFAVAAWLTLQPAFQESLRPWTIPWRFGVGFACWVLGLGVLLAWRSGRVAAWVPVLLAALELSVLYYMGPQAWSHASLTPAQSPILRHLAEVDGVGLVAGRLEDLPVRAGLTVAYPYLGISPPPPTYLLEPSRLPENWNDPIVARWMRRFGVTHGVWRHDDEITSAEVVLERADPVLDHFAGGSADARIERWKVVRYADTFPAAWAATRVAATRWPGEAAWVELFGRLSQEDLADLALYERHEEQRAVSGDRASSAVVLEYDGRTAVVEHDGPCDLLVRRAAYPGWFARIDGGPEVPVRRANGGLQAVPLVGQGTTRVELRYRPVWLPVSCAVTLAALIAAFALVLKDAFLTRSRSEPAHSS